MVFLNECGAINIPKLEDGVLGLLFWKKRSIIILEKQISMVLEDQSVIISQCSSQNVGFFHSVVDRLIRFLFLTNQT
jgi:hypothetical protein